MKNPNFKILSLILAMNAESIMAAGTPNVIDDSVIDSLTQLVLSQKDLKHFHIGLSGATISSAKAVAFANAVATLSKLEDVAIDLSASTGMDDAVITALNAAAQASPDISKISLKVPGTSAAALDSAALNKICASLAGEKFAAVVPGLKVAGLTLTQISNSIGLLDTSVFQTSEQKKSTALALSSAFEALNAWEGVAWVSSLATAADRQAAVLYFGDKVNGPARRDRCDNLSGSLTVLTTWNEIITFIDKIEAIPQELLIGATSAQIKQVLSDYLVVLGLRGIVLLTGADATLKRNNLAAQALSEIANHGGSNGYLTSSLTYTSVGAKGRDIGKTPLTQMNPGAGSVSISSDLSQKLGNTFPVFNNLRSLVITLIGGDGGYGNTNGTSSIVTPGGIAGNAISSENANQVATLLQKLTTLNALTLNLHGGNGGKTGNKSGTPAPSDLISGGMPIDLSTSAQYLMQSVKTLTNLSNLSLSFYGGNGGDGASGKVGGIGGNGIDASSVGYLADALKNLINLSMLNLSFSGGRGGYAAKSNGWTSVNYSVTSALTNDTDYTYTYTRYDGSTGTAPSPAFALAGIGIDGSSAKTLAIAIATLNASLNLTLSLSKSITSSDQAVIASVLSNITAKTITYTNN